MKSVKFALNSFSALTDKICLLLLCNRLKVRKSTINVSEAKNVLGCSKSFPLSFYTFHFLLKKK
jgi:hypothetical protein